MTAVEFVQRASRRRNLPFLCPNSAVNVNGLALPRLKMGQVSQLEHEEERRIDAARLGFLPELPVPRELRVRTGLDTTQSPSTRESRPTWKSRSHNYAPRKAHARGWAANESWLPCFLDTIASPAISSEKSVENEPTQHRVVVVVERVVHKPFIGDQEIWIKIYKRNDSRLSQRIPNWVDRQILLAKYPSFFCIWSDKPSATDCLAEWRGNDWHLIDIFNPWA